MEFSFELEVKPRYDYEPYEAPTHDCPGAPEQATIYGYRIKTPIGYQDMSDYKRADNWFTELKKAVYEVSEVGQNEDQHWQAVGRLLSVLKWFDKLDTLEHDLTPYLENFREEWEEDILQDYHESAIDAAESRHER